jgi:hypothetical protein
MLTAGVIRPFLKAHTSGKSLKLLLAQIDAGRARELDLWNVKISFPSRDSGEYFAMSTTGTDSDLHPSCVNDGAEAALLIVAEPVGTYEDDTVTTPSSYYLSGSYPDGTPDSQHSHDYYPCFGGQAHGQGAPMYSCGCYRRTKVEPAPADVPEQPRDQVRLEHVWGPPRDYSYLVLMVIVPGC